MSVQPIPPEALGRAVRELRKQHQLTQEALADAAGIHVTYLRGIERGVENPSWKVINVLAVSLELELVDLVVEAKARSAAA